MPKIGVFCLTAMLLPAQSPIDPALAGRYFDQAAEACRTDGGGLWGVSLYGPLMFADRATRAVAANQADGEGRPTLATRVEGSDAAKEHAVFTGRLPGKENIANTAFDWAGVRWTMVAWPLPDDRYARRQLIMHELFHRVQDSIGLPQAGPANNHLDSADGRLWLGLEWRALERALTVSGAARRRAIEDALVFRAYRRTLFPQAEAEERALEMHEGLAEYTGVGLSGRSDAETRRSLVAQLEASRGNSSSVRSFAYASGPAYGVLLDDAATGGAGVWRRGLTPANDLGTLLAKATGISLAGDLAQAAESRLPAYDGVALRTEERAREERHQRIRRDYQARFLAGPVLVIPLRKMNIQFDPNNVQPFGEHGTVYPTLRITDEWGTLSASSGALVSADWTAVTVPAPAHAEANPPEGEGWKLELSPGWRLQPGKRKGDYTVARLSRDSSTLLRSAPQR